MRYPDSLLMGLAKIGGLLALFKLGFLLRWLHQSQFEALVRRDLLAGDGQPSNNNINEDSRTVHPESVLLLPSQKPQVGFADRFNFQSLHNLVQAGRLENH